MEINPPLVRNKGTISRECCKSDKQTGAHVRVCLQDLKVSRERFPVFLTKGRLFCILHLKMSILTFLTPRNDVIKTLTYSHLF